MIVTRTFLFSLFFLSSFLSMAQKKYTIPFHLTDYNNLSVKAILNDSDTVNLMFHTAANAMTLTEESVKKLESIRFASNTDSVKSWGGQANSSRLSIGNSVSIGELNWKKVPIWENINSGQYTDGKFGIDLFKGHVIEIDFDNSVIHLSPGLPSDIKKYEKLKLVSEDDLLFIEADCKIKDSSFKNKFLLHSGYSGAILFDDQFANHTRLGDQLQITGEQSLKDSYGNIVKTKQSILPALVIQGLQLKDVPAGFFEGTIGRQKMSILGGDVLKRFNIVIDSRRENIYLKANNWTNTAYRKT